MDIEKDKIFELAERYVNCTGRSVFLTGKACIKLFMKKAIFINNNTML